MTSNRNDGKGLAPFRVITKLDFYCWRFDDRNCKFTMPSNRNDGKAFCVNHNVYSKIHKSNMF